LIRMEGKEPYATQEEFNRRVVRYTDVPPVEVSPGAKSHIISTEKVTIEFITFEPNSRFPVHRHEAEQNMIVMDGTCDELVDGKLYHLEKNDIIIIPSNIEHGARVSDRGCRFIVCSAPPRQDLETKLKAVKNGLKT